MSPPDKTGWVRKPSLGPMYNWIDVIFVAKNCAKHDIQNEKELYIGLGQSAMSKIIAKTTTRPKYVH